MCLHWCLILGASTVSNTADTAAKRHCYAFIAAEIVAGAAGQCHCRISIASGAAADGQVG